MNRETWWATVHRSQRVGHDWATKQQPLERPCIQIQLHSEILRIRASVYEYFWRRQWQPTPVLLPGKSDGRRSLVGCSPWGREESNTTERIHSHFSLSCIGEGNGSPLQCSCLENLRDGGALWADIYGVTQSRTRLKWLSSSSIWIFGGSNWNHSTV